MNKISKEKEKISKKRLKWENVSRTGYIEWRFGLLRVIIFRSVCNIQETFIQYSVQWGQSSFFNFFSSAKLPALFIQK